MKRNDRKKKLLLNTVTSMSNQILTVIVGFILPRLFLEYYGSEVNGLVTSITQFLGFISLMELGVGSVVRSTLYKPLVKGENRKISAIISSAQSFFNKVALIFVFYIVFLVAFFPKIDSTFSWVFSSLLILIIAISTMSQYFFGITRELLLNADQRVYITTSISMLVLILNTLVSVFLINNGYGIHLVKLFSMLVFLLKPLLLNIYVKKNYTLIKNIKYSNEPIEQKWNGLAQHLATFVTQNTDVVILTLFSTLPNISIYAIYNLIVTGIQKVIFSLTAGVQSLFGQMLANEEKLALQKRFLQFEWIIHTTVTVLFSCTSVLIVPFVQVYTEGINDANYIQPIFGSLITFAVASYCLRLPYNIMVLAAGHYRETQVSAVIEMILNITLSIILVISYGIIGVAIGTLIAMLYRTCYFAFYLSRNIIEYRFSHFVKQIVVDLLTLFLITKITNLFVINPNNYIEWFSSAILVFCLAVLIAVIINLFFFRKKFFEKSIG